MLKDSTRNTLLVWLHKHKLITHGVVILLKTDYMLCALWLHAY